MADPSRERAHGDDATARRGDGDAQQRLRLARLNRDTIVNAFSDLHDAFGCDSGARRTAVDYQRAYEKHSKSAAMATANGVGVNATLRRQLEYVERMAKTTREIERCQAIITRQSPGGTATDDDDDDDDDGGHEHRPHTIQLDVERYRHGDARERGTPRGGDDAAPRSNAPETRATTDVALAELARTNDGIERELVRERRMEMSPEQFYGRGATPSASAGWMRAGRPATLGSRQVRAALGLTPTSIPTSTTRTYTRTPVRVEEESSRRASPRGHGTTPTMKSEKSDREEDEVRLPGVAPAERPAKRRATMARGKKREPMVVDLLEESDEEKDDGEKGASAAAPPFELPVDLVGEEQPRRSTRASRYRSLTHLVGNLDAMYPNTAKGAVRVALADLDCLKDGEMLNDQCVDFYLKYLQCETLAQQLPKILERVHIFNSFFYQKLAQKHDQECAMDTSSAAHARVKTWTKNVDIFAKDFLLIPIHRDVHWSLIVVCNPSGKPGEAREPFLLHLDSMLGGHNSSSVSMTIKNYLEKEWIAQKGQDAEPPKFTTMRFMPTFRPHVPRQQNGCDCGVFILAFVEKLVTEENLDVLLTRAYAKASTEKHPNNDNQFLRRHWFPPTELADEMRTKVSMLIIQVITDACAKDDASRESLSEAYQVHARDLDERQSMTRKAEAKAVRAREKSEADRRNKLALQDKDDDDDLEIGLEVLQTNKSQRKKSQTATAVMDTSNPTASGRNCGLFERQTERQSSRPADAKSTPTTTSQVFSGIGRTIGGIMSGEGMAGKPATRAILGSTALRDRYERSIDRSLQSNAGKEEPAQTPTTGKSDSRQKIKELLEKSRSESRRRARLNRGIAEYFGKTKTSEHVDVGDESSEDGIALPKVTDDDDT